MCNIKQVRFLQCKKCIVGTGLEQEVALNLGVLAIAEHDGNIIYTNTNKSVLSAMEYSKHSTSYVGMYQRSNKITHMH